MTSADSPLPTTMRARTRERADAQPVDPFAATLTQQYTSILIVMSLLVITVHPTFHFILELIPGIPPDSLRTRLVSAAVSLVLLVLVLLYPPSRRWSPQLSIINAGMALATTHLLVLDSGNLPIYLAASLTTIYATQLAYLRMRDWLVTVGLVFSYFIIMSIRRGEFATLAGWVPPLFYFANYSIATALIGVRARLQRRELQGRIALQRANGELQQITEQLQGELVLARSIQQSLLPPPVLAWPRLEMVCYSQPAREVGGDFYSYHQFADGRVGLAVGDVSGKGVSAALLMATSISLVNSHVERHLAPPILVAELDRSLQPYTQPRGQNCALCYLELDEHTCVIVNAGGIPPYVRHADGRIDWPDVGGFALGHGLGADIGYRAKQITIAPDDLLVLVSDGVVEAMNMEGEMFGFDRLEAAIRSGPSGAPQAMVDHLVGTLSRFVGRNEAHDDLTLMVARVRSAKR